MTHANHIAHQPTNTADFDQATINQSEVPVIQSIASTQNSTRLGFFQHLFVTPEHDKLIDTLADMRGAANDAL